MDRLIVDQIKRNAGVWIVVDGMDSMCNGGYGCGL